MVTDYASTAWPAQTNPSIGANGALIPLYSTLVAGTDGVDLRPLLTDNTGKLLIQVSSSSLPSGAATSANQVTEIGYLTTIASNTTGAALAVNQTNGSQKTQVVDGSGNVVGVTSNAFDVNLKSSGITLSTNIANWGGNPVTYGVGVSTVGTPRVALSSDSYVYANQAGVWNINNISGSVVLPTGASTSANQTNGTQKTQVTDGTNSVTVKQLSTQVLSTDFGLVTNALIHGLSTAGGGTYVDVKVTPSGALTADVSGSSVTVSGTVAATQSGTWNVGLNAGSNLVGKVGIDQTTPGTTNGVSLAYVNSTAVATGNGVVGTGVQRVAIASDNTAFSVNAAQSGTWNIGTLTSITNAVTVAQSTAANLKATTYLNDGSGNAINSTSNALNVSVQNSTLAVTQSGTWTVQPGNTANTTAWLITQAGRSTANTSAYNDYSSANVTTSAYVQLVASTSNAVSEVEIFDSSGQGMILATGAAGAEVDQIYIFPGGNGRVPLKIAASTRVSIKAKTASATSGYIMINFYA